MAIEQVVLDDFTGGFVPRLAASDFSDRQWAKLEGFVLEGEARVRTQWPIQLIGAKTGFDRLAALDGWLIARHDDGAGTYTWWYLDNPDGTLTATQTAALTWTQLTAVTSTEELETVCRIPLRDQDSAGWVEALLLNHRDRNGSAWAVYEDQGTGSLTVKEWTDKWPDVDGANDNVMPPGSVGTMWADFLVLGDIRWLDDESAAIGDTNNKPHPNGIWFSQGGDPDSWDVLDVEFMGFHESPHGQKVLDLTPMDAGMLVVTQSGVALLRGNAADHSREPLRAGVTAKDRYSAAPWPLTGTACWIDQAGQVWQTDGEAADRLDKGLDLERQATFTGQLFAWDEYLLVSRADRCLAFTAFDVDGAWTELITPGAGAPAFYQQVGDQLYWLDGSGRCLRFNRLDALDGERGQIDGVAQTLTVATRTLERGGGHRKTWWHRFGVRAEGPGTLSKVTLRPGPALDAGQPTLVHTLSEAMGERYEQVVPAPGPSVEASAELEFTGDVRLEQCAWWLHDGRGSR